MSLKVGIVGLPNVGKSTLFKALTKNPVDINNYPFCTIEPNVGVVKVPDERLWKLAAMSKTQTVIPAVVEFVDIAGLVKGAAEGEGLGNKFLANIRECDAIVEVVRVFQNNTITHVHDSVDPVRDMDIIHTELILADLETIRKRKERLTKDVKSGDAFAIASSQVCDVLERALDNGKLASEVELDRDHEDVTITMRELSLITDKKFLYVYNVTEDEQKNLSRELTARDHVCLDIKMEEEYNDMSQEEMRELELDSHIDDLIRKAYEVLGLITYFTTGEKETRAWTIRNGWRAPQAASAIHTDFEKQFIRAEVVSWDKLLEAGSWHKAKENGTLRLEGKEYIFQDGDVTEFKI